MTFFSMVRAQTKAVLVAVPVDMAIIGAVVVAVGDHADAIDLVAFVIATPTYDLCPTVTWCSWIQNVPDQQETKLVLTYFN